MELLARPIPIWALALGAALLLMVRALARRSDRAKPLAGVAALLVWFLSFMLVLDILPADLRPAARPYLETALLLFLALAIIRLAVWLFFALVFTRRRKQEIPDIIRDLSVVALSAMALVLVIRVTFHVNLASVIATSAVVTIILGLALQDTLANLFAGLALQMEAPFAIGDWISFGDQTGRVEAVNWRSTTIRTLTRDFVAIPNSLLAKQALTNLSRPTPLHGLIVALEASPATPPNRVKDAVMAALRETPGVCADPLPEVRLTEHGESSIHYHVRFFITDYERNLTIQDQAMTRIWYHLRRAGIAYSFPVREVSLRTVTPAGEREEEFAQERRTAAALRRTDFLAPLSESEIAALAARVVRYVAYRDEVIIRQGEPGSSCFIVESGEAEVTLATSGGDTTVGILGPGQVFGEMSLMTGDERSATVRARTDLELIRVGKEDFAHILAANRDIARAIGDILARRQLELERTLHEQAGLGRHDDLEGHASRLMARILDFFGL